MATGDRAMFPVLLLIFSAISGFSVVHCVTDPSDGKVLIFMTFVTLSFLSFSLIVIVSLEIFMIWDLRFSGFLCLFLKVDDFRLSCKLEERSLIGVWVVCSLLIGVIAVQALQVLYTSLNSPSQLTNWKNGGSDPCGESWKGITCDRSAVVSM